MKKIIAALFVSIASLSLIACKEETAQAPAGAGASPAASANHAPAQAVPGSHEDWCSEHRVPESMCIQCNPALAAAFRATGDWCDEHGLPESQCRLCNPSLVIERPPQTRGE